MEQRDVLEVEQRVMENSLQMLCGKLDFRRQFRSRQLAISIKIKLLNCD